MLSLSFQSVPADSLPARILNYVPAKSTAAVKGGEAVAVECSFCCGTSPRGRAQRSGGKITPYCSSVAGCKVFPEEMEGGSLELSSSDNASASTQRVHPRRTLPAVQWCERFSASSACGLRGADSRRILFSVHHHQAAVTPSLFRHLSPRLPCVAVAVSVLFFARLTTALLVRPSAAIPLERNHELSEGRIPRSRPSPTPLLPATEPLALPQSLIALSSADISINWVPPPGSDASPEGPLLPGPDQQQRNLAGFPVSGADSSSSPIQQCMKQLEEETKQLRATIPPFGCPASTVGSWNTIYVLYAPYEGLLKPVLPQTYLTQLSALKAVSQQRGWHVDPSELSPSCVMALKWLHCKAHDAIVMCGGTATNWQYHDEADQETAREYCSKTGSPVFQACGETAASSGAVPEVYPFKGCRAFNAETGQNPPGTVIVYTGGTANSAPAMLLNSLIAALVVLRAVGE
ncbi:transmembrane protein [Cystoisospora suis]|uniref:Transmembrane protein n=1 Tax=Cystoisospora suis TaxID=483139 RepID=A0A2C6L872_9APIC|nr:transmembrane protein [Cystoisospora suis]